jgi:ribosomal protein L11 methyltransferase
MTVRWLELSIVTPGEYAEPIAHLFARHGDGRVAVESPGGYNPDEGELPPAGASVSVRGWLPVDTTTESRKAMIDVGLRLIGHLCPLPPLRERQVSDDEWRNQKFEAVRVGRRLVISPAGARIKKQPGDIVIPLDPGMAFGTGHHPTTRMCLTALERTVQNGCVVLDLGCGSGILSIAALKLGAARAVCLDIEEDAVASSGANLKLAGVRDRALVAQGSLPHEFTPEGGFDVVCANISANVIIGLAGQLLRALAPGGTLIASGVLEGRSKDVERALVQAGGAVTSIGQSGEWMAYEVARASNGPRHPKA